MKLRILGFFGGWRRRSLIAGTLAVLVAGVFAISAMGVHNTGAFELEGNAINNPVIPGDDWDNVCREVLGTNCSTTTGVNAQNTAVSWVAETNPNSSIFTGGGSKDPIDLDQWAWKDGAGGLPAKDNLEHGFAARYSLPSTGTTGTCPTPSGTGTCEMLFFGSDRFDNSGDATQGFWFFQDDNVGLGTNSVGGGTGFTGLHENGDLLVITDFSNGGGTSTIFVYEWDDTCPSKANNNPQPGQCGDTNLRLLGSSTNANCASATHTNFCGIVNSSTITMPWSFTDKSNTPNNGALNGEFFEGGVNLSQLGLGGACFANFASESRASTSTDATLKDFVLAEFAPCEAEMTTQVSDDSVIPGEAVHDTATVVGSNPALTPSGTVTFFMCTFAANSTDLCDDTDPAHEGVSIGTGTLSGVGDTATAVSPDVNTAASPLTPGRYCFRAEWPGDANYPQDPSPLVHFTGPECFTVAKLPSNTVTTPVDGSGTETHTITLNDSVRDKAVVTGTAAGGDPTGDVEFFVCGPIDAPATCATGGTKVGATKTLVSDGDPLTFTSNATSDPFTPTAVGRYCFRAEYGGSTIYNPSSDSGPNECFTVTDTTATATHQVWLPNDQATITSAHGAPISGTLSFTLHAGTTCTGTVLRSAETFTLNNAASPVNRSTTNQTVTVEATADVSWEVVFTSTNPFVSGSTRCETTSLTITN
jgi:hypothetical protein